MPSPAAESTNRRYGMSAIVSHVASPPFGKETSKQVERKQGEPLLVYLFPCLLRKQILHHLIRNPKYKAPLISMGREALAVPPRFGNHSLALSGKP